MDLTPTKQGIPQPTGAAMAPPWHNEDRVIPSTKLAVCGTEFTRAVKRKTESHVEDLERILLTPETRTKAFYACCDEMD